MKPCNLFSRTALLVLVALLFQAPTQAKDSEIYRGRAADGSVIFSDQPLPGTESIEIHSPQTIPALKTTPEVSDSEEEAKTGPATAYQQLKIVSPADDQPLRENAGTVTVTYASTPPLNVKQGDSLHILLDGKPVEVPAGKMSVTLENVDRGTHELVGEIRNYGGEVLARSPKTVFHLRRFSHLFKQNPKLGPL